jgi:conserved oligomeric Golgi complex subunit 6
VRRDSSVFSSRLPRLVINNSRTTAASYTVFFDAIAAQGRALLRVSLDTADPSLTPPQALLTHAQDLRAILALHTAEAEADDDGDGESEADGATIERALDALVDPAVRMCVGAAEEKDAVLRRRAAPAGAAATWDRPVFVLNCLTYLADTLAPHPCAARKRAELDSTVEVRVRELIEEHVRIPVPHPDYIFLASYLLVFFLCLAVRKRPS